MREPEVWTEAEVADRLAEAADTLRRLPAALRPAHLTSWPDIVHRQEEAYGWHSATPRLAAPSPAAISRLDHVLDWLIAFEAAHARERQVLWGRARGVPWRRLSQALGASRPTLAAWHAKGLARIVGWLNGKNRTAKGTRGSTSAPML